jgi:GAF domain-containing protein
LDADLDALLREVLGLGFEFAALSTVDPYQREIVMSRSVNIPAGWVRRSRRPIDDPTEIMADVLRTGLVETPRHDDSRFEQSTYRLFRHDQLARVYVPLHYGLDKPVAVVQAGWERQRKGDVIPRELADRLDCLAGQKRELIARSAPHMFLEELCRIVLSALQGCDAVTLHLYQDGQVLWVARAGACSDQYVIQLQGILGLPRVAAAKRNPEWIDEAEKVRAEYPALHDGGWRSVALVPLETGPQTIGVLTVLFEHEQRFGKWLLEQILLLGRAVESAIQTRLLLIESAQRSSRAWMQSRLKTVEDALEANAPLKEVLQRVAEHFLYNLEADCVTLYEYDGRDFRSPPNFAGEFRDQGAMAGTIMLGNLLWQCLERSSQFYRDLPTEFLANRQDGSTAERFAVREGIKSCAVLVLETEDHGERAGLIFVNYRRIVGFSPEVRVAMAMLAASASVAIRTARQIERRRLAVESMQQIDRAITMSAGPPDLDSILRQVLGSACSLTGAWRGRILWFAPNRRNLEWRVAHGCPVPAERIVGLDELPVVRQVLAQKRFIAVPGDVPEDARLAVPLGDSGDILGIVVLEGTQRQRFSSEDALTVEMLGVLAVAGARFTDLQRPLVSLSAVAARLQEQPFDLDTALRVILTGVTAGEGLGFTRAMVFLREGKTDGAKGRLATGPLTGSEAEKSWEDFENLERQSRPPDVARFTWLLDRAEESSRKIREGGADSVLSRHVQALWLPASLWETRRPEYESAVSSQ